MSSNWFQLIKAETFFLDCTDFRDLVRSQWPIGPVAWVTYRLLTTGYLVAILIWALIEKFQKYQFIFFTFLTHWSYLALVLSYVIKLAVAFKYYKWLRKDPQEKSSETTPLVKRRPSYIKSYTNPTPVLLQISWLAHNISIVFAFYVSQNYIQGYFTGSPILFTDINFQLHGVNTIFAIIEILFCAVPTFLLHVYQPLLFMALYEAFTAFYYVAGGKNKYGQDAIYSWLDWTRSWEPVVVDLLYMGALSPILYYIVLYVIVLLRRSIGLLVRKPYQIVKPETV